MAVGLLLLLSPILGAATVPRPAPEFAVQLNGGKQISLSSYRGKVVVLAFILTYCPHCQKTLGFLSKMQTEYGPKGFQVIGSAVEDMAAADLPEFLRRFRPPFPMGFNTRAPVLDFLEHPARLMMPQVVFVDRRGVIRGQYGGDDPFLAEAVQEKNLRGKVEDLLQEPRPTPKKSTSKRRTKS